MASLSSVTSVFEKIVRQGIERGVFSSNEPKLVALNALFLCHQWSLHARALRTIAQRIEDFFEMQADFMLQGMLARDQARASPARRTIRRSAR